MFKSNVHTLDHTLDYQNPDMSRLSKGVDTSLVTYDPQNLTEIPNLAYDYLNNISGYDLISDDQNSVISSENDNEIGQGKLKKEKVIPVYSSKNNSQKRFVLNKKLLGSYQRKTPKGNTALGHYNVKMNPISSKSRKKILRRSCLRILLLLCTMIKESSCINPSAKNFENTKALNQNPAQEESKACPTQRAKNTQRARTQKVSYAPLQHLGSMFNLVTSSCSKAFKKMRKSKSPGISKTRAPTR